MSFKAYQFSNKLLDIIEQEGYSKPTPIQGRLIPKLLASKNVVASAQTGSGKTLAYLLPILEAIAPKEEDFKHYNKAFILSPTKELAQQIYEVAKTFALPLGLRVVLLQGGGNRGEEKSKLKRGVDIIIATPQRALEYIESKYIDIKAIRHFVVDEADMMFDMGFINYIEKTFVTLSPKAQKIIISATITPRVVKFTKAYVKPLERIEVDAPQKIADTITQELYPVRAGKKDMLLAWLISHHNFKRVMVFVRKKELADGVAKGLEEWGYKVGILHGERSHQERKKSLHAFKSGAYQILVATDIAARGLDIADLEVVINYDIPHVKHDFIHRVGRTGRAGKEGRALTLVTLEEIEQLNDLHKLLGQKIKEIILPDFAPKEIKARGFLLGIPLKRKPSSSAKKKTNSTTATNKRGKKRKTTKRDGFKAYDAAKPKSDNKEKKSKRGRK